MSYRLNDGEASGDAVRRIAREQLESAVGEATDTELARDEAVHQVRKRTKKVRALLRLARDGLGDLYKRENAFIRDAARELSFVRDAASVIESYDRLLARFEGEVSRNELAAVRRALTQRRERVVGDSARLAERLAIFAQSMREALGRIDSWPLDESEFELLRGGLVAIYKRGRNAMRVAYEDGTAESFHEWRKQAKGHWYHLRVLEPVWPDVLQTRKAQTDLLCDLLGQEHDLGVLRGVVHEQSDRPGVADRLSRLDAMIDTHQRELRDRARLLGFRIFADRPKALGTLLASYWEAWRLESGTRSEADSSHAYT